MSHAGNRKPKIATKKSILLLSAIGALMYSAASSSAPRQNSIPTDARAQQLESLKASLDAAREELVDSGTLSAPSSSAAVLFTSKGSVPDVGIAHLTFTKASITPALSMLLKDTNARVTVIGGDDRYGTISAQNINGRLPEVLENLSNTMGFFYSFSNDTLIVSFEQSFSVGFPPNADEATLANLTDACVRLGARFLKKDSAGQVLVFSAPKKAFLRVNRALAAPGSDTSLALAEAPATASTLNRSAAEIGKQIQELEKKLNSRPLVVASLSPSSGETAATAAPEGSMVEKVEVVASVATSAVPHEARQQATLKLPVAVGGKAKVELPVATSTVASIAATGSEVGKTAPLISAPVASSVAAPVELPVPAAPAQPVWSVTPADKSVRALLSRWARDANYQLLWDVPVDLELGATATIAGTFDAALQSVLASLSNSDYPIEAMMYDNRVVRIVKYAKGAR